jgi:hypothetical protein
MVHSCARVAVGGSESSAAWSSDRAQRPSHAIPTPPRKPPAAAHLRPVAVGVQVQLEHRVRVGAAVAARAAAALRGRVGGEVEGGPRPAPAALARVPRGRARRGGTHNAPPQAPFTWRTLRMSGHITPTWLCVRGSRRAAFSPRWAYGHSSQSCADCGRAHAGRKRARAGVPSRAAGRAARRQTSKSQCAPPRGAAGRRAGGSAAAAAAAGPRRAPVGTQTGGGARRRPRARRAAQPAPGSFGNARGAAWPRAEASRGRSGPDRASRGARNRELCRPGDAPEAVFIPMNAHAAPAGPPRPAPRDGPFNQLPPAAAGPRAPRPCTAGPVGAGREGRGGRGRARRPAEARYILGPPARGRPAARLELQHHLLRRPGLDFLRQRPRGAGLAGKVAHLFGVRRSRGSHASWFVAWQRDPNTGGRRGGAGMLRVPERRAAAARVRCW